MLTNAENQANIGSYGLARLEHELPVQRLFAGYALIQSNTTVFALKPLWSLGSVRVRTPPRASLTRAFHRLEGAVGESRGCLERSDAPVAMRDHVSRHGQDVVLRH